MTSSFTSVFGGSAVSPTDVAFKEYAISANLTLFWPAFANGQPDVTARFMNIAASVGSLDVFMPDATLVSVGYDVIIFNNGSNTFNVVDSTGGAIATITAGQTYYILLNDNTTAAGSWQTVQFGVGTGSASAAALAGEGLIAIAGLLNTNTDVDLQSIDYSITALSRARLQVWNGGAGVITLPTAASVGDGFFFPFANNGTGSVTITPSGGDQIDEASTSVFTQTQSAFIVSSGTAWYTVGKGLQNNFAVTLLNLNVAGSSDVVETSAQAQNVIQQYTGALTGNINVIVPNTVQLYYAFNNTTGPYTLTIKTAAGTGFVIPQGEHVIVYCDGTNVLSAFSTTIQVIGTPTYSIGVAGGTANALTGNAANFVLQLGTVVWLTPSLLNTGPATLNVQATGNIAIKKVDPAGLVDISPNDFVPGLVNVVYYNGTYWISVNTVYEGPFRSISGSTTLDFTYFLRNVDITAAINLTLPAATSLPSYFRTTLLADGGALTLIPNGTNTIQGINANYIVPQGSSLVLATDGISKWVIFLQTSTGSVTSSITNDTTTNASMFPVWVTANTGSLPLKVSSTKLSFNPSTAALTTTTFIGALTGNADTATLATTSTNVTVANEGTDTTCFPLFVTAATGNLPPKSNAGLAFNSNTGALSATSFVGPIAGNASTATALATPRAIYGNNFDGTAALTQIIASTFGGTGNGFSKFSGPTTTEKTFVLPDASATILTDNTAVTVPQGGTGLSALTTGNVILGAGTSNPTFVAPGTSGNVLTSNGSTWTSAVPIIGSMILLGTATASTSASLSFTSLITSSYDMYMFQYVDIKLATASQDLIARYSNNNGSTYLNSGNNYGSSQSNGTNLITSPSAITFTGSSGNGIAITGSFADVGNGTNSVVNGHSILYSPNSTTGDKVMRTFIGYVSTSNMLYKDVVGTYGVNGATGFAAVNAIQFLSTSGNITSGKILMYGIKNT